jgi:protein-tyrosine sulfotransferase
MTIDEIEKIRKMPFVFTLGLGRSGTTLLQLLFDAHPNIVAPPESKFIILLYPRFHSIRKWTEEKILEFVDALYIDPLFSMVWSPDREKLSSDLLSAKDNADYSLLCKIVCYHMKGDKENIMLLAFKTPLYTLFAGKLEALFPEAKFIHLVRDPMDNLFSQIKSFHVGDHLYTSQMWLGYNSILEDRKQYSPAKYYTLYYEKMVGNLEGSMKELCNFFKISYDNKMLQPKPNKFKDEEMFKKAHNSLLSPISTSNVGGWELGLSAYDKAVVASISGRFASEKYGYDFKMNADVKISQFKLSKSRMKYYVWQHFTLLRYKNLNLNILYSKIKQRIKGDKLAIWNYF